MRANARAGRTNRLLAPLAKKVLSGFSKVEKFSVSTILTGNPVRSDIALVLQCMSGSLMMGNPFVCWCLGELRCRSAESAYPEHCPNALPYGNYGSCIRVVRQGRCADSSVQRSVRRGSCFAVHRRYGKRLRLSGPLSFRAGAMTVSELSTVGRPAILIPIPMPQTIINMRTPRRW